jgi:L-ascorbate metabolism protein UlaG (beta-lactamase superfamily)
MMIHVTWTGAAGLIFEGSGQTILIEVIDITRPAAIVLLHYDYFSRPHIKGAKTKKLPFVDLKAMVRAINAHVPATELIVAEIGEAMHY